MLRKLAATAEVQLFQTYACSCQTMQIGNAYTLMRALLYSVDCVTVSYIAEFACIAGMLLPWSLLQQSLAW